MKKDPFSSSDKTVSVRRYGSPRRRLIGLGKFDIAAKCHCSTWIPAPRLRGDRLRGYDVYGIYLKPELGDLWPAIILNAGQFSGGDKPHPYLTGERPILAAGFIPA